LPILQVEDTFNQFGFLQKINKVYITYFCFKMPYGNKSMNNELDMHKESILLCKIELKYRYRRIYQYNEDDNFLCYFWFLLSFAEIPKHLNKERLPINSFSLFTCKLVIKIMLVSDQSIINYRLYCIDIIADHCKKMSTFLINVPMYHLKNIFFKFYS